jgi:hypothetical protein
MHDKIKGIACDWFRRVKFSIELSSGVFQNVDRKSGYSANAHNLRSAEKALPARMRKRIEGNLNVLYAN